MINVPPAVHLANVSNIQWWIHMMTMQPTSLQQNKKNSNLYGA